jgi:hypothetical protein
MREPGSAENPTMSAARKAFDFSGGAIWNSSDIITLTHTSGFEVMTSTIFSSVSPSKPFL